MTTKEAIRKTLEFSWQITQDALKDLQDADLLVRSVPAANHIAWQLGHLIVSEHEALVALGHAAPDLPPGFVEAHARPAAGRNEPQHFGSKADYLALFGQVRAATIAALEATPAEAFDTPAPEKTREYAPTIGDLFLILGWHELMHVGQYAPVRRMLGKPILY